MLNLSTRFEPHFCNTYHLYATRMVLTHWGRVTHICVGNLTIIGSYNGLSPWRRQAIIWTNARIILIGPLATNFSEILVEIQIFSFKITHLKMSSGKRRQFCLGLNVLSIDKVFIYAGKREERVERQSKTHLGFELITFGSLTNSLPLELLRQDISLPYV